MCGINVVGGGGGGSHHVYEIVFYTSSRMEEGERSYSQIMGLVRISS